MCGFLIELYKKRNENKNTEYGFTNATALSRSPPVYYIHAALCTNDLHNLGKMFLAVMQTNGVILWRNIQYPVNDFYEIVKLAEHSVQSWLKLLVIERPI